MLVPQSMVEVYRRLNLKQQMRDFFALERYQEAFYRSTAKYSIGVGPNRCLPLDAPVLMADGQWKSLGDVVVGDFVISESGSTEVINAFRAGQKECFKVGFEDGNYVVASREHNIPISLGSGHKFFKRPLGDIVDRPIGCVTCKPRLRTLKKVDFGNVTSLPIHPYLYGALLGDGGLTRSSLKFFNVDAGVLSRVGLLLANHGLRLRHYDRCDYGIIDINGSSRREGNGRYTGNNATIFKKELAKLGATRCSGEKSIAHKYKISSAEDRMLLLAGLIDTDGSEDEFCSKSFVLASDFCYIVKSLGGKATLNKSIKTCTNASGGPKDGIYWRVYWRLNCELPIVLKRKQVFSKRQPDHSCRIVKNVESVGMMECGDITVADPSHNFIAYDWVVVGNSGKTEIGAITYIDVALGQHPTIKREGPQKLRVIGPSMDIVLDAVLGKFKKFTPRHTLFGGSWDKGFNFREKKLKFKCGSYVQFMSDEQDTEKHAAVDLDGVWFDEQCKRAIFHENISRLGDRNGFCRVTLTPDKGRDFIYTDYIRGAKPGTDIECFFLNAMMNPYIDRVNHIRAMANFPERTRRIKLFGEAIDMTGLVYGEFSPKIHIVDQFKITDGENWNLFIGFDFGINNPAAAVFWAINSKDEIYQIDEIYVTGKTVEQFGELVRDKIDTSYAHLRYRYGRYDPNDGDRRTLQSTDTNAKVLRKALGGKTIFPGERGPGVISHRINAMHTLLLPDLEKGWARLRFMRNCHQTIREMEDLYRYPQESERRNNPEKPRDKDNHAMTASEYLAEKMPKYAIRPKMAMARHSQFARGGIF